MLCNLILLVSGPKEIKAKLENEIVGTKLRGFDDIWKEFYPALSDPIMKHELISREILLEAFYLDNNNAIIPAAQRIGMIYVF